MKAGLELHSHLFWCINIIIQTQNGIATFMFNGSDVSFLRIQIVQETASWMKANIWGQLAMSYSAQVLENHDEIINQFNHELEHQVDIKPWETLSAQYTNGELNGFTGQVSSNGISISGVIKDQVIYLYGAHTRFGEYPYPRHMRQGAFSVTKSMGAAIAFFTFGSKIW